MVAGFTSWDDIGSLFLYTFALFILIIILSWVLHKNKQSLKGGSQHYASIPFVIVIIIIILAVLGAFGNLYGGHAGRL